jgi:hypothetical protein
MICPQGHVHLGVTCPCGCGRLRPTSLVRAQFQVPSLILDNVHVEDSVEHPFNLAGNGLVVVRDLTCKDSPTPFNVSGEPIFDIDGIDYESPEYRPPRRERRKKKKR